SSARAHYTEQMLRLIAGAAFVWAVPEMRFPRFFEIFGWFLAGSALVLMVMPWHWHRRFGEWTIPVAVRHAKLYAAGALALGVFVLYSVL
ncbi:MAG: hypothetical protein R3244_09925, partial [Thermoanaerobaculia bacterium]|nr:hypothetical protein [Thermoanaerobaculia bacterium]